MGPKHFNTFQLITFSITLIYIVFIDALIIISSKNTGKDPTSLSEIQTHPKKKISIDSSEKQNGKKRMGKHEVRNKRTFACKHGNPTITQQYIILTSTTGWICQSIRIANYQNEPDFQKQPSEDFLNFTKERDGTEKRRALTRPNETCRGPDPILVALIKVHCQLQYPF